LKNYYLKTSAKKKQKEVFANKIHNQYIITLINKKKQKSNKLKDSRRSIENELLENEKKTIIDNINDFCSYNIPSTYSNNNDELEYTSKNCSTIVLEKNKILLHSDSKHSTGNFLKNFYSISFFNKTSVIKNIENFCLDLNNCKKCKSIKKINDLYGKVYQNSLESITFAKSLTALNLFDFSNNMKQLSNKVQLTRLMNNSTLQIQNLLQILKFSDTLKMQRSEFYDQLWSLISTFDLYNIYQQNDDFQTIYNQFKITNTSIQKLSNDIEINNFSHNFYKSIKKSEKYEETNMSCFDTNTSRFKINIDDCLCSSLKCSPFYLDKSKQKDVKYLLENSQEQLFPEPYKTFQVNNNKIQVSLCESKSLKFMTMKELEPKLSNKSNISHYFINLNTKLKYKELKSNLPSQNRTMSDKSSNNYSKLKKKMSQNFKYNCIGKNFCINFNKNANILKVIQDLEISESIKPTYNRDKKKLCNSCIFDISENQNMKVIKYSSQYKQSFREYNLKNNIICKTPSSITMFRRNNKLQKICFFDKKLQYPPSTYNIYSEIQRKKMLRKNILNSKLRDNKLRYLNKLRINITSELKNNVSDDKSILLQSSNESNSNNYESYKIACTEALTFD
jgi:hypothetical protein